ncbi:hypothetical protein [Ferruginibacter profundus]
MKELDMLKLFAIVFLFVVNNSCMDNSIKKSPNIYKVKLAFEQDFYNESRIDTVEFSKPKIADSTKYNNELTNYVGNQFFKVEEGELKITAVSMFERNYSKTININSDTTIIFNKNDFPVVFKETETWDEELNLKPIDTIVIYSFNGSCVTTDEFASVRKISCFKNDTDYLVKFSNLPRGSANDKLAYQTKKTNSEFTNILNEFYAEAKKAKEKKQEIISTSNAFMYIRINNKIYQVTDPTFSIGKLYDTLIAKINGS